MTDRTVAEAMGWDVHNPHRFPSTPPPGGGDYLAWKCAECGEWVDDGKPRTECSSPWNQHPKPTPDDMLAWLRGHTYTRRFYDNDDSFSIHTRTHPGAPVIFHRAPTLHAALEAAVLAVSAAQDEQQQGDDGEHDENGGQHA